MNSGSRTEKTIKKKKRRKKRYLLRFIILLITCIALYFVLHIEYFLIDGITVAGNKAISDKEIIELSKIKVGDNIFDAHPLRAQRKIKENLYIEDVDVNRLLPNRIEIVVKERMGEAQFAKGKKMVITDKEGLVLEITEQEQQATYVENVKVKKARLDKPIEVEETAVYDKAMILITAAGEGDLFFKKLNIEGNEVNAYVYDKLVCKGKYEEVLNVIKSGALKAVIFDLYQKDIESGIINIGSNNYCSFTPQK
ncbi:MAG: FtsQ-type POTRA domain-containing protein [Firmicutes bacterium]|nr:FtsQ-type POTRA domain-containing protein [Bacillota bacterium]